ncbi:hypothetical protein TNCV_2234961 [Trichonephila clavipes]|nr:hypothetical protein TNCV_2234961 [Trichonephila clavipes]
MGKKGDISPCKKAKEKALVNANLFSNREISRRLKVSEASVRLIKKKIESRVELSPKRKKKWGRKPIFTPRKPKLTLAIKAKRLNWAKQWPDEDVDFWRSVGRWIPRGVSFLRPRLFVLSSLLAVVSRRRLLRNRPIRVSFIHYNRTALSLRLRGLSPEFGLLKENSRKRTKMPTEQEAKPAVVTPSLQQWRSPSTFRGAPGEDPLKWLKETIE